jgi:hypothetical protein
MHIVHGGQDFAALIGGEFRGFRWRGCRGNGAAGRFPCLDAAVEHPDIRVPEVF